MEALGSRLRGNDGLSPPGGSAPNGGVHSSVTVEPLTRLTRVCGGPGGAGTSPALINTSFDAGPTPCAFIARTRTK